MSGPVYRSYACAGGFRHGHANSRYDTLAGRDDRGCNDDRPAAWRGGSDRDPRYGQDRGCGGDLRLHDR